jgi:cytochrome c oxidase cbb3-type subunit 3
MRIPIIVLAASVMALLTTSCETGPANTAASGATPAVSMPVGPVPGLLEQPNEKLDPYANDRIAIAQGRTLFLEMNCYGCHGGHGGGGMGPSLRDATWIYGGTDAEVFSSIAQGRAHGMPAWGTRLPDDQIWKLVAYIKSMRTPLEADPPTPPSFIENQ